MDRDLYTVLSVPVTATQEEIHEAYLRVSRVVHPDRFDPARQPIEWKQANEMLREANAAYRVLRDPPERSRYDARRPQSELDATTRPEQSQPPPSGARPKTTRQSAEQPEQPSSGQCQFGDLPNELKGKFVKRQQGTLQDHYALATDDMLWKYVGLVVSLVWLFILFALADDTRWDDSTLTILLVITGGAALLGGWSGQWIWKWHRSPLKCHLLVTPLYFIHIRLNEIRWWPLWSLQDINITHHYRNGAYSNTELKLDFPSGPVTFFVSPVQSVENWMKGLRAFDKAMRTAVQAANWDYFEQRNEFHGVESQIRSDRSFYRSTVLGMATSLLISAGVFLGAYTNNANNPSLTGVPPSSVQPQRAPRSATPVAAPVVEFDEPAQPLPANGYESRYNLQEAIAPLEIRTRGNGTHYFVKLVDWNTESPVAAFFVRAGQTVEVDVPLGSYRLRYATGRTWYGERYLFGPETIYSQADSRFDFVREGDQVSGYTVELFMQADGNLSTSRIRPDQW